MNAGVQEFLRNPLRSPMYFRGKMILHLEGQDRGIPGIEGRPKGSHKRTDRNRRRVYEKRVSLPSSGTALRVEVGFDGNGRHGFGARAFRESTRGS